MNPRSIKNLLHTALSVSMYDAGAFKPEENSYGYVSAGIQVGRYCSVTPTNEILVRTSGLLLTKNDLYIGSSGFNYRTSTEEEFFQLSLMVDMEDLDYTDLKTLEQQYDLLSSMLSPKIMDCAAYIHRRNELHEQILSTMQGQQQIMNYKKLLGL